MKEDATEKKWYSQNQVNEEQSVQGAGLSLNQQGLGLFCHIPNPRSTRIWKRKCKQSINTTASFYL